MSLPVSANLEDMSYYESARECKVIQYCLNQNTTLNLLLKARIQSTPLNLQTATSRVYFASTEGKNAHDKSMTDKTRDRQKRNKITSEWMKPKPIKIWWIF